MDWHRVEDGVPDDEEEYLVTDDSGFYAIAVLYHPLVGERGGRYWHFYNCDRLSSDITHWCPIDPPEDT